MEHFPLSRVNFFVLDACVAVGYKSIKKGLDDIHIIMWWVFNACAVVAEGHFSVRVRVSFFVSVGFGFELGAMWREWHDIECFYSCVHYRRKQPMLGNPPKHGERLYWGLLRWPPSSDLLWYIFIGIFF